MSPSDRRKPDRTRSTPSGRGGRTPPRDRAASPLTRIFDPLRSAAAAFFKHDVALRRADDGAVHIVLEERKQEAKPRPPGRAEIAAQKDRQDLDLMRVQLAELLDELPETRQTMRHLGFVEQALAKRGLRALNKLPLDVLQRALDQFEGLVVNWSPAGLASLRSRMAVAIIDREHLGPDSESDAYRTSAVLDAMPMPSVPGVPEVIESSDDEALAAAYAALGDLAPGGGAVEFQGELGSPSAQAAAREAARPLARSGVGITDLKLRELQR